MGSKTHIAIWTRRPMKTTTTEDEGPDVEWCRPFFENWNNCAPSFTLFPLCDLLALIWLPFFRWITPRSDWKALLCATKTDNTWTANSNALFGSSTAMVKNSNSSRHMCARVIVTPFSSITANCCALHWTTPRIFFTWLNWMWFQSTRHTGVESTIYTH